MITLGEMIPHAQQALGTCDRDIILQKLHEAIELLANEGHWDPLVGFCDICTQADCITLPVEVEVPLAVNIGGYPATFRDKWFEFHMNGPGSCCGPTCDFHWEDMAEVATFRDPIVPSPLAAFPDGSEANGSIRVYGFDENDKWITETNCITGKCEDGLSVPLISGTFAGMPTEVKFKKIVRVSKPLTKCFVKLVAYDEGAHGGTTLIGYYRPKELEPRYRRIKISGSVCQTLSELSCTPGQWHTTWVRMRFRRKVFKVEEDRDMIPLHSVTALKLTLQSIYKYERDLIEESNAYFEQAKKFIAKEQKSRTGPGTIRLQFDTTGWGGTPGENMV